MTQDVEPAEKAKIAEELKPAVQDYSHQDSLFGNAFSSKAYFIVHPEWLSENVDPPKSQPLPRKPWPWEQPKYRQNVQRYENGQMTPDTSTPGQNTPLPEFSEPEPGYSYTQPLRNNYESEILERKPAIDLSTGRFQTMSPVVWRRSGRDPKNPSKSEMPYITDIVLSFQAFDLTNS
eukprot:XP_011456648.2 PREDICTED: uncharacterized protein LOC105348779 [Crassostrea gigas]